MVIYSDLTDPFILCEFSIMSISNCLFQDYAANTMNELLAIYGYDEKVDKSVTEDLQLQNFSGSKQGK